jgi:hypothetical protein
MQNNEFHITIGANSEEGSFENDLRLVKASLLYADKITLCSPLSNEAFRYLSIIEENPNKQLEFLESFASHFMNNQESQTFLSEIAGYKKMISKKHLNPGELLFKMRFEGQIKKSFNPIRDKCLEVIENFGMSPILKLMKNGILKIEPLNDSSSFDYAKAMQRFIRFLEETISNHNTYPLFNAQISDIVRLGIKEDKIKVSQSGIARGKHSSLAANLLERLPLFDEAEVDEILDIRRELERPLIRFRSSMFKFSDEIKNASWDEDFSYDAEVVFKRDIEPAILDIEDAIKSNNFLSNIARKVIERPLHLVSGSALTLLMSQLSELPHIVAVSFGIGTSAGLAAYDAYKEWHQNNLKTEQNGLFFYYKAKQNLSNLK